MYAHRLAMQHPSTYRAQLLLSSFAIFIYHHCLLAAFTLLIARPILVPCRRSVANTIFFRHRSAANTIFYRHHLLLTIFVTGITSNITCKKLRDNSKFRDV